MPYFTDDGTCDRDCDATSHENAGHAPGSYRASAIGATVGAIGLIVTILGALVCAWVTS